MDEGYVTCDICDEETKHYYTFTGCDGTVWTLCSGCADAIKFGVKHPEAEAGFVYHCGCEPQETPVSS